MAGPLGVNVSEFIQAIQISKQIFDSFFDPFENAPEQIRLLVSTSEDLHGILTESEELLKSCNRAYPGQKSFNRRLQETDAFIRKYRFLVDTSDDGTTPLARTASRSRQIFQTFMHTFEERKARRIHEGLMFEMQKFIQFILVLAL
jgi:hypothetical protein